jgi:type IV pilus assembly protein PilE
LAVLAAYAVPAYRGHLMRGHRMEAKAALYRAAQWLERWRADAAHDPAGSGSLTLPAGLDQAPQQGTAVYRLQVLPGNSANGGYTLQAQPVATGPMGADEECATFELDATGRRANPASALGDAAAAERCWNS